MDAIPKEEWLDCPNCGNVGWYWVMIDVTGNGECQEAQEQCEFCYRNPKSVFNQENLTQGSSVLEEACDEPD